MVERIGLNKKRDKGREEKQPSPIEETPLSKANKRYDPSKLDNTKTNAGNNNTDNNSKSEETSSRRRGRPKSSRTTRMARLSVDNVNRLNALKETLSAYNQDEVFSDAIDLLVKSLNDEEARLYKLFLSVQETRSRKQR